MCKTLGGGGGDEKKRVEKAHEVINT